MPGGCSIDFQVFEGFIRQWADKAYNFAFRLSGNEQDARDLVQEAFARAFEHRDRYDAQKPFDTWLNSILRNVFLDRMRRYEHLNGVSLDAQPPMEDSSWEEILPGRDAEPIDELLQREEEGLFQEALAVLPEHYRAALVLCDIEGLSYEQSAVIMGCPIGTVRSRVHQGRLLLRKEFEKLSRGAIGGKYEQRA